MAHPEVIGRRTELAQLHDLAAGIAGGAPAGVGSVRGDAGIGKSTLLDATADDLAGLGFTIVRTGLTAAETPLAWAGLRHLASGPAGETLLAAAGSAHEDSLLGAIGRRSVPVEAGPVALGLAAALESLAARGPVALLVDDLHWLDRATASAVALAVRSCAGDSVLALFASRPLDAVPLEPDRLLPAERTARLVLAGLSPAGLHHLLLQSCGISLRRPELIRLHEATGGNPLHAIETGRLLATGRSLDEALLPPSLQATIAERLGSLPPPTRRVLETAALAASPSLGLLRKALPEVDVEGSLLVAEDSGVIEVAGETVAFTHPLLRAGVLDSIGTLRRRRLLLELAEVVPDADERALLLAAASPEPDETVAAAVADAAERAAERGTPLLAAERLQEAAARTPDTERRAERLARAAELALAGGDPEGALAPADEAARLTGNAQVLLLAGSTAVLAVAATAPLPEALARAEALLERLAGHPALEVRALRTIARIRAFDDLEAARVAIERAEALVQETGDPEAIAAVTVVSALIHQQIGDPVDVDEIAAIARRSMSASSLPARGLLLELLTWTDRVDEAIPLGREQLAEAEAAGSIDDLAAVRDQLADSCFRAGRWDEAEALVRATLEADRIAMTKGPADCRPADLAQTLAARGRHAEAEELLGPVLALEDLAPVIRFQRAARAGFIRLAAGRWDEAVAHLREARDEARALGEGDLGAIPFRADLVEALVHVGALDEASEVVEEHGRLARHSRLPRGLAESARTRGLLLGGRGDHDAAVAAFEEALEAHATWPVPFERARTLLALAGALRRVRRRSLAAERLDEAEAILARLGAAPWLARVADERARLGVRRTDGTGLTPTERRIAELVAAGRSNAEIAGELVVSVRTVESNLTKAYRKLGVRSRTELAARLRETS